MDDGSVAQPSRKATQVVTIIVLDVNDNAPQFDDDIITEVEVPEGASRLLRLPATDPDAGDNGTAGIVYSLQQVAPVPVPGAPSPFIVEAGSGLIVIGDSGLLDREVRRAAAAAYSWGCAHSSKPAPSSRNADSGSWSRE